MAIFPPLRSWVLVGIVLALGVAAAVAGPLAPVAAVGMLGLGALVKWPILLPFALIVYEPLEALLVSGMPQAVKTADELVVVVMFVLVLGLELFRHGLSRLLRHFLLVPTLLFILASIVSALLNDVDPAIAATGVFVTLDYVLLALLLGCLDFGPVEMKRVTRLIFYVTGLVSLVVLAEIVRGVPFVGVAWPIPTPFFTLMRYHGPFEHPNDLANFMVFPVALAIGLLFHPVSRMRHVRFWLVVSLLGFLLAVGRVAWLALFLAFLAFLAVYQRKRSFPLFIKFLPLLLLFSPLLYYGLENRITATLAKSDARILFTQKALPIVRDYPLLGVGPGRFGGVVANRYGSEIQFQSGVGTRQHDWNLLTVDNFWLHLIVESGLIGTACYMLLLIGVLRHSHRVLRYAPAGHPVAALAASCFILTLYEMMYNVSAPALEDNTMCASYWLLVGVVSSYAVQVSAQDPAAGSEAARVIAS